MNSTTGLDTTFLLFCAAAALAWLLARRAKARKLDWYACESFDLSLVRAKYLDVYPDTLTSELDDIEREFRRFFYLAAGSRHKAMGLQHGAVDDFGHAVILCTPVYHAFCEAVCGRYVHHDPRKGEPEAYARTCEAYCRIFRQQPPARYWPRPEPAAAVQMKRDGDRAAMSAGSDGDASWLFAMTAFDGGDGCGGGDGGCSGGGCGGGCGD